MTRQPSLPPDLVRRFTPTPYVFEIDAGRDLIRIEADDLQLALSLRHACRSQSLDSRRPIVFWRLVRERCAPPWTAESSLFSCGRLKTLLQGTGTLLVEDVERREVFGFIDVGLPITQFTQALIPLLMHSHAESSSGSVLQTSDK
jgi:hypothetical protein